MKFPVRDIPDLNGYGGAVDQLQKVADGRRRETLTQMVELSGVHGRRGLLLLTGTMRWLLGERKEPLSTRGLAPPEISFIRRRAVEMLGDPHMQQAVRADADAKQRIEREAFRCERLQAS